MKELEDERRLDERREACLNAIFAGFAMEKSSTTALKVGVSASRMPWLALLGKRANAFSLTSTSPDAKDARIGSGTAVLRRY